MSRKLNFEAAQEIIEKRRIQGKTEPQKLGAHIKEKTVCQPDDEKSVVVTTFESEKTKSQNNDTARTEFTGERPPAFMICWFIYIIFLFCISLGPLVGSSDIFDAIWAIIGIVIYGLIVGTEYFLAIKRRSSFRYLWAALFMHSLIVDLLNNDFFFLDNYFWYLELVFTIYFFTSPKVSLYLSYGKSPENYPEEFEYFPPNLKTASTNFKNKEKSREAISQTTKQSTVQFCYKCGTKLTADSAFCHKCGSQVAKG